MTRLPREARRQLEEKLATLRRDVDEIRTDQTFGASDVRMYVLYNQSSSPDITLTNLTTTTTQCVEVTLTPNTPAKNPAICFDFTAVTSTNSGGGAGVFINYIALPPVNGVQKFRFYFLAQGGAFADLEVSFMFWTISPATYTFQTVAP